MEFYWSQHLPGLPFAHPNCWIVKQSVIGPIDRDGTGNGMETTGLGSRMGRLYAIM